VSFKATQYVKHLTTAPDGSRITPSEKGVLMQLADDHNEDRGCAWPRITKLAPRCNMHEVHCRRLIRSLEKKGLLESTPDLRDNGGRTSNQYRFPAIDPPFDQKQVALIDKRMRLQAALRSAQPAQQKMIYPPNTDVRPPQTPKFAPPKHGSLAPPNTDVGGVGTPMLGHELSTELPLCQESELGEEHRNNPLPPSGVKVDPVDAERFDWLKTRLKSDFGSIPENVARRQGFTVIAPSPGYTPQSESNDYDVCFRSWWLVDVRVMPNGILLVTEAEDEDATAQGMEKYKTRLSSMARLLFQRGPERPVTFKLLRRNGPAAMVGAETSSRAMSATPADTGASWTAVKLELARRLKSKRHSTINECAIENYRAAIESTQCVAVEMDAAVPVWTIASLNAAKTKAVMAMLRGDLQPALTMIAGSDVQLVVVDRTKV
jgi:hypothetical protein